MVFFVASSHVIGLAIMGTVRGQLRQVNISDSLPCIGNFTPVLTGSVDPQQFT